MDVLLLGTLVRIARRDSSVRFVLDCIQIYSMSRRKMIVLQKRWKTILRTT